MEVRQFFVAGFRGYKQNMVDMVGALWYDVFVKIYWFIVKICNETVQGMVNNEEFIAYRRFYPYGL